MNCCPPEFSLLTNGVEVRERNIQADGQSSQFFPYSSIKSVRYSYSRGDGGTISLLVIDKLYCYEFPCSGGQDIYEKIVAAMS